MFKKVSRDRLIGFVLLGIIVMGISSYLYFADTSARMKTEVEIPSLTHETPANLRIRFVLPQSEGKKYPIAPLDKLSKEVTSGISISPAISGKWFWYDEDRITFVPKQDWPANQLYKIHMNESLFAKEALAPDDYDIRFTTLPFGVDIQKISLQQAPADEKGHHLFSTLRFTHPVNTQSLAEHLKLYDKAGSQELSFTLNYEDDRKTAYVKSEALKIGKEEKYIHLVLTPEVKSDLGGSRLNKTAEAKVLVPDTYSFLKINSLKYNIIENKEGEPEQILHLSFTDAIDKEELMKSISFSFKADEKNRSYTPKPVFLDNEHTSSKDYFIKTEVPLRGYMQVQIKAGMNSVNGFQLRRFVSEKVYVPNYPHEVKIVGEGSLLASSGEKKLSFMVRGISALKVSVQKLMPDQINHLISQTYGNISSPTFRSYTFTADNITQKRLEKIISFANTHPKERNYASLDLNAYMKEQGSGVFFVSVTDWDKTTNRQRYYVGDTRMVVVTDMGIVVKKSQNGSRDVFVESIHSGKPVSGAVVSVLGKNGQAIKSDRTDANGKVSFVDLNDYSHEQAPTVFIAKHGKDVSFIPYTGFSRQIDYSRFDVGGVRERSAGHEKTLSAFAFSDRGIYRPGEKVHLGAVIRQGDFHVEPGIVIKAKIYDVRNNLVLEKPLKLDKNGFFELDLQTQYTSATGRYSYNLYLPGKYSDTYLGGTTFSVEAFQPDTMKIKTSIKPNIDEGWVHPKGLKAEVRLSNLFGTAAQNRKIKASVQITPQRFYFSRYEGFRFKDPFVTKEAKRSEVITFDDITTDLEGRALFDLKMPAYDKGTYAVKFSAEGFEPDGGRSVSAKSSVLVSPLAYMVGTKADGDLEYLKKEQDRSVEFIAVDANLSQIALDGLSIEHVLNKRISVLTKQPEGSYKYETVIKKEVLSTDAFKISDAGVKYKLPTGTAGFYSLNIMDKDKAVIANVEYQVIARGNMTGALEKNSELSLKLDKSTYKAGEVIEMNIVAPYTGTGLITIESDKVHAHKWFKTASMSTIEKIKIPSKLEGNAYVNVTFVRSIDSDEIFASPLSYAVKPFKIDLKKREVDIALEVPRLVKPGEELKLSYSTDKPSKIVVYAVNEGILQVAGYRLPKPLSHFLKKRALSVETSQMLDLILPEYSRFVALSGIGGGMMESMAAKAMGSNLNPFKRTLDAPAVYWSGIVDADTKQREVSFIVPDSFSGNMKIMAVAVADEAMGSAQEQTLVRGPFVLSPNVLNVVAPGDEFEVTLGVSNAIKGSGKDALISASLLSSQNLRVLDENIHKIKVSEGDEGKVTFRLKALDEPGEGKLVFSAQYKDQSLDRSATLSIRPAQTHRTTVKAGYEKSFAMHEVSVERKLYEQLSSQTISASASPFVLATGMTDYLENYPHGCTEQIISQSFPWIGLSAIDGFSDLSKKSKKNAQEVITMLQGRQLGDGGFGLWPTSTQSNTFASIYAMHFLIELYDNMTGVYIPSDLLEGGMDYLRAIARNQTSRLEDARLRAIAIYLLTRKKEVATNYLVDLHDDLVKSHKNWQKDITSSYIAASYKMLLKLKAAQALIGQFDPDYKAGYTDFQSDMTMHAQHVYLVSKHFKEKELSVSKDVMPLLKPVLSGRLNTISSSYTVMALSAYSERNSLLYGKDELDFYVIDKTKVAWPKSAQKPFKRADIPTGVTTLGIQAKTPIFYQLIQSGFDKGIHTTALASGIEIYKEYVDDNGTEIKEFTQGQEVEVRLKVRLTDRPYLSNVVLTDLLPGGFEVIRKSVPRRSGRFSAEYVDIREDRVVYYGSFFDNVTELRYKVKVTAAGTFVVPSASAKSMYDTQVQAYTASSMITVRSAQ